MTFSCLCSTEAVGIAHKPPRSLQCENSRSQTDKQTDTQNDYTVTLAAHARRGLIMPIVLYFSAFHFNPFFVSSVASVQRLLFGNVMRAFISVYNYAF